MTRRAKPTSKASSIRNWLPSLIRNIGIVAHVDAGKTTVTERILFLSGAIERMGEVDDGTTLTDWMQQEQERGISITAAATTLHWRQHLLHLVDTPGHVDFAMEVERSLQILDGVVVVFCAVEGVQPQSEAVWHQADRVGLARLAFVNKCDRPGADIDGAVNQIRSRLGANPVLLQLPLLAQNGEFAGTLDLITMKAWSSHASSEKLEMEITPSEADLVNAQNARDRVVEQVAECDEELLSLYLSGPVKTQDLVAALRRATLTNRVVPTLIGAAKRYVGVTRLLDAIVSYLPSAQDRLVAVNDPSAMVAQVFKVMRTNAGRIAFLRVYSGTLMAGDHVVLDRTKDEIVVGTMLSVQGNATKVISQLSRGMIGAMIDNSVATGDTLLTLGTAMKLGAIAIPQAVMAVALEADKAEDQPRLAAALAALLDEDPSLHAGVDPENGRTLLYGLGELHLEIAADRIRQEFGVVCVVGRGAVAYRETIEGSATETFTVRRPIGPKSEFGEVRVSVAPGASGVTGEPSRSSVSMNGRTETVSVEYLAPVSEIPSEYREAVLAGVFEALEHGVITAHPMTNVVVRIDGGAYHPVDSCNSAYKLSAYKSTIKALTAAQPLVLEPLMAVEIVTPDDCVGDVIADLHTRRGKITGITARTGVQTVACFVPMACMFGYSTDLRSKTRGRATCSLRFDHYQPVPKAIRDELSSNKFPK